MTLTLPDTVILSRPDRIGDAVITTPTAGAIKQHSPRTRVIVLAQAYTRPIWERCAHVDGMITLEELDAAGDDGAVAILKASGAGAIVHSFPVSRVLRWAKQARIAKRVATNRKLEHWFTCNVLVGITRKRTRLHEAQYSIQLLRPFGVPVPAAHEALSALMGLTTPGPTPEILSYLSADRRNIVLHPLTDTGPRWGVNNFADLIARLDPARYHIMLTGTAKDAEAYRRVLPVALPHITDLGGRLSIEALWSLLGASDAMVASSTGPLHLAAASGILTIGIYGNWRVIGPERWGPIGPHAHALVRDPDCPECRKGYCDCFHRLPAQRVADLLDAELA